MSEDVKFIGITGTAGAGKDTVADIMCRVFGAVNLSSGDVIRAVTRHVYGLPADFYPERGQLYEVANFLRNEVDPAFAIKVCMLEAKARGVKYGLITGLRTMGEADAIRAGGGVIIGVDADPKVRYERIYLRGRDAEAQKTYQEFFEHDTYENRGLSDTGPSRGIRYIIDGADFSIENSGSLQELEQQIKAKLSALFT